MTGKKAYQKKIQAKLKQWGAEIDYWAEAVDHAETQVKRALSRQMQELQTKQEILAKKLEDLKKVSEASWEDVKGGTEKAGVDVSNAIDSVKKAFRQAVSRFKDTRSGTGRPD